MVLIQGCASWLHIVHTLLLVGGKAKISLPVKKANVGFHGEGDMGVYGIPVLGFFSCGILAILILTCGIAAYCGII